MSLKIRYSSIINILWLILLCMIFCFPRKYALIKFILMLGMIINGYRVYGLRIKPKTEGFLKLWLSYAVLTLGVGIMYGNSVKGCIDFFRLNIFYFVLLAVVTSIVVNSIRSINYTQYAVVLSSIYIFIYNVLILVFTLWKIPADRLLSLDGTAAIGLHEGYIHITSTNISMLMILFPINLYLYLINKKENNRERFVYIFTAFSNVVTMFISGRRILWITIVLTLVFAYFWNAKTKEQTIKLVIILSVCIIAIIVFVNHSSMISFPGVLERLLDAFSSKDSSGEQNVRLEQISRLLKGFLEKPLFGNGAAAVIPDYSRNSNAWVFEMSYHEVLFQSGVIGMVFYAISLLCIWWNSRFLRKRNRLMTGIVASVLFVSVLANATNPYFSGSFDFLIMLFLPIYFIEIIYCKRDKNGISINYNASL